MSTLAAARADNMYYPPEWRPEMGGISKFQGSNGHNQYEKYGKIRFELPVHGWCLGCGRHIGRVSPIVLLYYCCCSYKSASTVQQLPS